jgi:diketogulonate reductase-like aldo/keto reductase
MQTSMTLRDGTRIPQIGFGTLSVPPDRTPTRPIPHSLTAAMLYEGDHVSTVIAETSRLAA